MKTLTKIQMLGLVALLAVAGLLTFAFAQASGTHDSASAQGQKHRHFKGQRGFDRGGAFFKNLNLTDAQKSQMKQIRQSYRERTASLHQELRAKQQELRQSEQGTAFSESLAAQKLSEMSGLKARLMSENFKMRQESLAVLTPEQKAKFDQQRAEFKSKWAERHAQKN